MPKYNVQIYNNFLFRYVLSAVKSGRNVFFTGGAGTGKSFLVQKIIGVILPFLHSSDNVGDFNFPFYFLLTRGNNLTF